jgi:DNA topoisomerase-1
VVVTDPVLASSTVMAASRVFDAPPRTRPKRSRAKGLLTEHEESAKAASLRYVSDSRPGIRRWRSGRGFSYVDADGRLARDKATLMRIRALAIPPAWTDVWICPLPNGHLQATGRDARHRKQYRYHKRWHEVRDETKYERMILFGHTLPRIRARVANDLALEHLPRENVLATIVRLLETTFIRVGNEEYARTNGSFGLTTLLNEHVRIEGPHIRFRFQGKSGKSHSIKISDRRLAKLVKRIRDLPGQDLFQYLDEAGEPQPISSSDVNDYLRVISDEDFTAKDFRTWAGTLLAARQLAESHGFESESEAKAAIVSTAQTVAKALGNTPAICRKCYIHPAVLNAFQDPATFTLWQSAASHSDDAGLSDEEATLLTFLTAHSSETG